MPLLSITTSNDLFESVREKILREASSIVAKSLGKTEAAVMVILRSGHNLFGGDPGPSAFLELRSASSLDPSTTSKVAQGLCEIMEKEGDIPQERIYLNFMQLKRSDWGWNGKLLL